MIPESIERGIQAIERQEDGDSLSIADAIEKEKYRITKVEILDRLIDKEYKEYLGRFWYTTGFKTVFRA